MKNTIKVSGARVQKAVSDPLFGVSTSSKNLKRQQIEEIRGDAYDILADALKWNSLLTTMVSRIYSVLPETQKALLDPADRGLMEYTLTAFATTQTRADKQLVTEGVALVDKILSREAKVGALFA